MHNSLTIYKQIYPQQCTKLAALGYRSLINIRPDNEGDTQPSSAAFKLAAVNADLCYVYLPFCSERLQIQLIQDFAAYYHNLPKPILLFCGSGSRAKLLYQAALMQNLL